MSQFPVQAQMIMNERFGQDKLISIATSDQNIPYVRAVDSVYRDGCFYVITHAQSSKIKQIEKNPIVAICGEWFTGHGLAENLGHVLKEENLSIYNMLKKAFEAWIDNGHIDETNKDTVLLCIRMKTGILYSNGVRYDIEF